MSQDVQVIDILIIDGLHGIYHDSKLAALSRAIASGPIPGFFHTLKIGEPLHGRTDPDFQVLSLGLDKLQAVVQSNKFIEDIEHKYLAISYTYDQVTGCEPEKDSVEVIWTYLVDKRINQLFKDVRGSLTCWAIHLEDETDKDLKIAALNKHFRENNDLIFDNNEERPEDQRGTLEVGSKIRFTDFCEHAIHHSQFDQCIGIVAVDSGGQVHGGSDGAYYVAFTEDLIPAYIYHKPYLQDVADDCSPCGEVNTIHAPQ